MKRTFTLMVPVQVTLYSDKITPRELFDDFQLEGKYPISSGTNYEWQGRFDKIRLKDIRTHFERKPK